MDALTARPTILKQANISLIRKVIKNKNTATRAEIASETQISSTTIRSLIAEMMKNGEIESIGYDESSGGRKAERYRFKPERYYGATFCLEHDYIQCLLVNVCGEINSTERIQVNNKDFKGAITLHLDNLIKQKEIKSIGIGVRGVVEGGSYWRKDTSPGELYKINIGEYLFNRYSIPVVLENNINATAIGFLRCHERDMEIKGNESANIAYLHFDKGCVKAGFIAEGRIIRGNNNFAGEFGLLKMDNGKPLDEYAANINEEKEYVDFTLKILNWVCGILNPKYIVFGGRDMRKDCVNAIRDGLSEMLPENMLAEILVSRDAWSDYCEGMAYLTAGKMFDDIQLIKE